MISKSDARARIKNARTGMRTKKTHEQVLRHPHTRAREHKQGGDQCTQAAIPFESVAFVYADFGAPQTGHVQVSGRSSKATPPPSFCASYTWPQTPHVYEAVSARNEGELSGVPGSQSTPGFTHSFNRGQHTSPSLQSEGPPQSAPGFVGTRHFFASGQQYAFVSLHGLSHAAPTLTQSFDRGQQVSSLPHTDADSLQLVFVGVKQ